MKKNVRRFIVLSFLLMTLSACGKNKQSTPEATLDNFFASVNEMAFEEAYEFMDPSLQYEFEEKTSENLDKNLPDEIENSQSYQEYAVEIAKLYKEIDYEILESPSDHENNHREYTVRVSVPDISAATSKAALNYIGSLFGSIFAEEEDSESYEDMENVYASLAEDLKNEEFGVAITEGVITIALYEEEAIDSDQFMWLITEMDRDVFNALTPGW